MNETDLDVELRYRYQERLAMLCGSAVPSSDQVAIAIGDCVAFVRSLGLRFDHAAYGQKPDEAICRHRVQEALVLRGRPAMFSAEWTPTGEPRKISQQSLETS